MKISKKIKADDWQETLAERNKAHIPDFLEKKSARNLYSALSEIEDWDLVFWKDGARTKTSVQTVKEMSPMRIAHFKHMIHDEFKNGFQYFYKELALSRISTKHKNYQIFKELYDFINSKPFLDFAIKSLQLPEIEFADMQITCYEQGHFLSLHNDDIKGQNRLASYVLNFTPDWQPDWGGKLEFFDENGHVEQAYIPKFNALNIFKTPLPHAVSSVSSFCPASRLSISGWFRGKA